VFQYLRFKLETLGALGFSIWAYPRLYPVHEGYNQEPINLSCNNIQPEGAYLLDCGTEILFWIGMLSTGGGRFLLSS